MPDMPQQEPTVEQISSAILKMLNTLLLVRKRGTAFYRSVEEAICAFDQPELRASLVNRLRHPEKYVKSPTPSSPT